MRAGQSFVRVSCSLGSLGSLCSQNNAEPVRRLVRRRHFLGATFARGPCGSALFRRADRRAKSAKLGGESSLSLG